MLMRRATAIGVALALGGCGLFGSRSPETFPPEVTGTVTYRERFALPRDAELRVTLYETSQPGAEAKFIAEQIRPNPGQVPLKFRVSYPPSVITPQAGYSMVARIEIGGRLVFRNEQPVPVLTAGHPDRLEIQVTRVSDDPR